MRKKDIVIEQEEMLEEAPFKTLKESPLFCFSLGSKELFHSNFLWWLAEHEKSFFQAVLCQLLGVGDIEWNEVKREEQNFDFCLKKDGRYILLLENKVKSIPRKSQLDEYYEKAIKTQESDQCNFVLLTLSETFPNREDIEKNWKIWSYEGLGSALVANINMVSNAYNHQIISDYCVFANGLHQLMKRWVLDDSSKFFPSEKENEALGQLRIHDLREKLRFAQMECLLETEYFKGQVFRELESIIPKDIKDKNGSPTTNRVYIGHSLTRAEGLLDVKIWLEDEFLYVIQIQGCNYKHGIEIMPDSELTLENIAKSNQKIRSLHYFSFEGEKPNYGNEELFTEKLYPTGKELFNKYGNHFKYQNRHIKAAVSVRDVLQNIKDEIEAIMKIYSK